MRQPIPTYWWQSPNFGDRLTEALLNHFGVAVTYTDPGTAALAGIGSIIEHVPAHFAGMVLGAGVMHASTFALLPQARFLALRGPLTWGRLGQPRTRVLGDPGLLAAELVLDPPAVTYRLGILPHYVDQATHELRELANQHPGEVLWINALQDPITVIHQIAQCAGLVSSSLHGLIVADSLGIPSVWKYSDAVIGSGFKFADYAAAMSSRLHYGSFHGRLTLDYVRSQLRGPQPVQDVKLQLLQLFKELPQILEAA